MPACTWVGESSPLGDASAPYGRHRYRARNPVSTAAGKYQMIDSTFHANGGPDYGGTHDAAQAPPLLQEKVARRVLARGGLGQWANC